MQDKGLTDRFAELSDSVEQSSRLLALQLQSVDSSLLAAFVSLVVTSFLSKQLGLLMFWVPASFFLMWIVLMVSLVSSTTRSRRLRLEGKQTDSNVSLISERNIFVLLVRFKNGAPLFKTIGVIFFVSFLALVLKEIGTIGSDIDYPPLIPIISSLVFLSLPILNNKAIGILEKNRKLDLAQLGCLGWFFIFIYVIVYIIGGLFVLPILSLVALKALYIKDMGAAFSIFLVVFLQIITALTFMNYFSAMSVKKEITQALNRLSNIQQRISEAILTQKANDEILSETKESYLESKPYDISADDSLLVNFYSLVPNPAYLSRLKNE